VYLTLHIQSNCRDTDFVGKLIELQPDGRAMLLMDGVVRAMYRNAAAGPQQLAPEQVYQVTIQLGDIHHTFAAGSRLQVDITSSNFPRRARNTNSGNAVLANDTAADIQTATNVVHHSEERPSFIVLPMLPTSPGS
jgi:putative CocE/NonD family hydrolase